MPLASPFLEPLFQPLVFSVRVTADVNSYLGLVRVTADDVFLARVNAGVFPAIMLGSLSFWRFCRRWIRE